MAGLNLGVGGGVRIGGMSGTGAPASIQQVAYGAESGGSSPTTVQSWHLAMGVSVAGVAFLVFLRWSLPR